MIKLIRQYSFLAVISGAVILFDQWTKSLVRANLGLTETWSPWEWLEPYARIVHWKNTGAAFGMLQGFGDVFTILAILVSIAILFYFPQVPAREWTLRVAMGLQLGGAVGNLIDRLTIGWVTDFLSVGFLPVFNVADASITTGVVVLILGVWAKERHKEKEKEGSPDTTAPRPPSEKVTEPLTEEPWGE